MRGLFFKAALCCILLANAFTTLAAVPDTSAAAVMEADSCYTIAEQVNATDGMPSGFVGQALRWYDAHMSYIAVGALMTIESSFIPFPSEVVVPPAVYVACNPEGTSGMKVWLILIVGTLGALLGAIINYILSRWLGRPVIYAFADSKLGHMLSLSREKMERAEDYFNKHGSMSTLVGRLIPVIRQLISIPAGLSRMPFGSFVLFTTLGALIWNAVLTLLGWLAYRAAKPDLIEQYSHQISIAIIALCAVAVLFVTIRMIWKRKKKTPTEATK